MSRSKLTSNSLSGDNEEIIELSRAILPKDDSSDKLDEISNDFTVDIKSDRSKSNSHHETSLSKRKKGTDSDDPENSETTNLIHSNTNLRLLKSTPEAMEEKASTIVRHIERNNKLMQNDLISENLRLEMIRNMPQCLTLKRSVKAKVTLSVSQRSKKRRPIGYWKKLKYQASMSISKIKLGLRQIGSSIELWHYSIKKIEGHFGSGIAAYFKFLRWLFIMNLFTSVLSNFFITLPQALVQSHQGYNFSSWDLILGNGFFTNSILYYGFYFNSTISFHSEVNYDMPSAYFLTFVFCYVFTFIVLFFKVARSYKKHYIETSDGAHNQFANKIFCSWDWGISSYRAASLCSASIYRELEELLSELKNLSTPISWSIRVWTFLIRLAMTTLTIVIMCGIGVLLWLLLNESQTYELNVLPVLTVPIVMTLILNFFPPMMSWAVKCEKYSRDRIAFYITMIRVYAIAVIAVATLLTFWLTIGVQVGCWQSKLAQEVYRLIFLDLIVSVIGSFAVQGIRSMRLISDRFGAPTFDIAHNTLSLIYNQSLFWLVHYLSPPMSLIVIVKLFLTFHIKKVELLKFCEPPKKFWRAGQTETLFLALTFLGMISAVTVLVYALIYVDTSSCGPFAGHEYTWEFVVDHILRVNRESKFWIVLGEIANPGTGIAILVVMCVAVYCLRAKAEASKQMVRILREMLIWQARDKEFLLKTFSSTTDERWLRHRQSSKLLGYINSNSSATERSREDEPSTSNS